MADIAALFERLKNNKLAVPALVVGVAAGGYVLIKKGGLSGAQTAAQTPVGSGQPPSQGGGGGSGGGGTDYSGEINTLQDQQKTFAASIVDQFNKLTASIGKSFQDQQGQFQNAIGQQNKQTSDALSQLAGQQQSFAQQIAGQLSQGYQGQSYQPPDFTSLFQALAAIPNQIQQSYQSPGLNFNGGNFQGNLGQLIKPPVFRVPSIPPQLQFPKFPVVSKPIFQGTIGNNPAYNYIPESPNFGDIGNLSGYKKVPNLFFSPSPKQNYYQGGQLGQFNGQTTPPILNIPHQSVGNDRTLQRLGLG